VAQQIDIRKVVLPDCECYESVEDTIPVTFTGRLKGITEAGHQALLQRKPFCRLLRTLVKAIQTNKTPNKAALCGTFHLPARVYNTVKMAAEAIVQSAIESQKAALEDLAFEINRQVVDAFWGPAGELHGRVRKLMQLYQKRKRLLAQQGHPHIHFGKKFYLNQERAGWKKAYEEARSDRLGSLGSADERGGNSTFPVKPACVGGKLRFELYHVGKLMGHFTLKPKEREELEAVLVVNHQPFKFTKEVCQHGKRKGHLVDRKVTTGRVPLTVWLIRHPNRHWYVHISFFKDKVQPDYAPVGAIGADLNCDSIADAWVEMTNGKPSVIYHHKRVYDPGWGREEKEAWIYQQINQIVLMAKANRCMIVLEYLDFEHCKRWLRTKLGAMLRIMPYRKIRQAFERRCMELGVVLRYVKSNYTSVLGAVLTDYPNLGRDEAAAAIIGLRAMEAGNAWLEQWCHGLAAQERARLRINRKSKFGCTVTIDGVMIDRQLEATSLDRETDTHWFQNRVAREISGLSKAMGVFSYTRKWLPTCWKRSGPVTDPWHPVVPEAVKRRCQRALARL
jgi:IS605 OrfB family transposase